MRRSLVTAIALALASSAVSVHAQAQTVAAPAATEVTTQLPRTARPVHYRVEVTPHAEQMTFDGKVSIELDVLSATDSIVLQAAALRFSNSKLVAGKGTALPARVSVDEANQTATFAFDKPLVPGRYTLSTDYSGIINTQANGLFARFLPLSVV